MITHVALMDKEGVVWKLPKPHRHHNVIHLLHQELGWNEAKRRLTKHTQGFVNDKGEFLDRFEGWEEAKVCRQILPPYDPTNPSKRSGTVDDVPGINGSRELFSEDLW